MVGGERREGLRGAPSPEERVGHRRGPGDGPRIDPVEVLQIVADVGEPVQHRFGRRDAREPTNACDGRGGEAGRGRVRRGGDVGAVRELGVDAGLTLIRGVEDRRGRPR